MDTQFNTGDIGILNKEVFFDTTPNAWQLYNVVMQGSGYTMTDGLGDITDNSLDADATNVALVFKQAPGRFSEETGGGYVEAIWIIDDGHGMNANLLAKSFVFATKVPHAGNSLGHFGAGGSAASFTIADDKTVLTKAPNGQLLVGTLSKSSFGEDGSFKDTGKLRPANHDERQLFMEQLGIDEDSFGESHGTIIELKDISKNLNSTAKKAAGALQSYCAEVFHKFIANGITFKTIIKRDDAEDVVHEIVAADPLMHDIEGATTYKHKEQLQYEDPHGVLHNIDIRYSILSPTAPRGGLIEKQGIYVYRNNRQIVAHSTLNGLWKKSGALYRSGRIELNFPNSLDDMCGLTSAKNKVVLSEHMSGFLRDYIDTFRMKVGKESQTPTTTKQEIEKQEKATAAKIVKNGATFGVPEYPVPAPSGRPNPDSGRGPDKKKRKKKGTSHTGRRHGGVEFKHVNPTVPTTHPWWYEIGEDLQVNIFINDSHKFIIDRYTEAKDDCKELMREIVVTDVFNQIKHQDNNAVDVVMRSFYDMLTDSHNLGI